MPAHDTVGDTHSKLTAPGALGRRRVNGDVAHRALREQERERREQIATRCHGCQKR